VTKYRIKPSVFLYYPSDHIGVVGFDEDSHETFFINLNSSSLKKLLVHTLFDLPMLKESFECEQVTAKEILNKLLIYKIINEDL